MALSRNTETLAWNSVWYRVPLISEVWLGGGGWLWPSLGPQVCRLEYICVIILLEHYRFFSHCDELIRRPICGSRDIHVYAAYWLCVIRTCKNGKKGKRGVRGYSERVTDSWLCYVLARPSRQSEIPKERLWWVFGSHDWSHDLTSDPSQCLGF